MIATAQSPKPHRFQFRLRTLFAAMTVLGTLFVAVHQFQEWRRRERARAQFEQTLELWDTPRNTVRRAE